MLRSVSPRHAPRRAARLALAALVPFAASAQAPSPLPAIKAATLDPVVVTAARAP